MLKFARRLFHGAASGLLAVFLAVTCTPLTDWFARRLAGQWTDQTGDTLVVLAGGDLDDGFPAENTMLRCLYAARAYREERFRRIVVTGFQTSRHMRSLLIAEGVPAETIVVEDAARSTRENAINVLPLVRGARSVVLLTSDYHMWRAARAFRKAGIAALPRPIPDARKRCRWLAKRWAVFQDEAVESGKIGYYFLRGWI